MTMITSLCMLSCFQVVCCNQRTLHQASSHKVSSMTDRYTLLSGRWTAARRGIYYVGQGHEHIWKLVNGSLHYRKIHRSWSWPKFLRETCQERSFSVLNCPGSAAKRSCDTESFSYLLWSEPGYQNSCDSPLRIDLLLCVYMYMYVYMYVSTNQKQLPYAMASITLK